MKTSNKIILGYLVVMVSFCIVDFGVCFNSYTRTLPQMRTLYTQLDTANIRIVKILPLLRSGSSLRQESEGSLLSDTPSIRFGMLQDAPLFGHTSVSVLTQEGINSLLCNAYPEQMRMSGDTLLVPFTYTIHINIRSVESVILPDGEVKTPPFVFCYERSGRRGR